MRKRKGGGGANWQDTYGDMVTLLLCFFVLLYSLSTLDQQKWQILIRSLNPDAVQEVDANVGNQGQNADPPAGPDDIVIEASQEEIDQDIDELYEALKAYVSEHQAESSIQITKGEDASGAKHVFVAFNDAIFFDGDSHVLRQESEMLLDFVGDAIAQVSDSVDELRIIGNTARADGVNPNDDYKDRMLSVQRATEVLVYLQRKDVLSPDRMVSVGYGEWRPVGDNKTQEGRAANRRVEMIVTGKNLSAALDSVEDYYAQRGMDGEELTGEEAAPLMNDSPIPQSSGE